MADKKNLLQTLVDNINNNKINEFADVVLRANWTPTTDAIEDELNLFSVNSMLTRLQKLGTTIGDFANFIENSANSGSNTTVKNKRLEVLRKAADRKGPFKGCSNDQIIVPKPRKVLNAVEQAIKNDDLGLIHDQNTKNGGNTKKYRELLLNFLEAKRPAIESSSVDIVAAVLASVVYYTLPTNTELSSEEKAEYEKAVRPLVYGLIKTHAFTGDIRTGHSTSRFGTATKCRELTRHINYCLNKKQCVCHDSFTINDGTWKAYLGNQSLFTHLKDVTSDFSDWNVGIAENSRSQFLTINDKNVQTLLSSCDIFENKFETVYKEEYNKIDPENRSSSSDPNRTLKLIQNVAARLAEDPDITDADAKLIAIALARPLAGISQATAENSLAQSAARGNAAAQTITVISAENAQLRHENNQLKEENDRLEQINAQLREGVWAGIHYFANTQGNEANRGVVDALRNVTTYTDADRKAFAPEVAKRNLTGAIAATVGEPESHSRPLSGICSMIQKRNQEYLDLQQQYEALHKRFAKDYGIDGERLQTAVESDNAKEQILKLDSSANVKSVEKLLQAYADYQNKPNQTLKDNIAFLLNDQNLINAATDYIAALTQLEEPYRSEFKRGLSGLTEKALSELLESITNEAIATSERLLETKQNKFKNKCLSDFAKKVAPQIFKKLANLKNTKWDELMASLLPNEENKTQKYIESLAQATIIKSEYDRCNIATNAMAAALTSDLKDPSPKGVDTCMKRLKALCKIEEIVKLINEERLQAILAAPDPKNPNPEAKKPYKELYEKLYNFSALLNEPTIEKINNLIAVYKEKVASEEAYQAAKKKLKIINKSKLLDSINPNAAEGLEVVAKILAPANTQSEEAAQEPNTTETAAPVDGISNLKLYNTYCTLFNCRKNFIDLAEQLGLTVLYNEIVPVNSADWKNFKPAQHNKEIRKQAQDALKNCRNYYNELVKAGLSKQVLKDLLTRDDRASLKEFSDQTSSQEAE